MKTKSISRRLFSVLKIALICVGVLAIVFMASVYYSTTLQKTKTYGNCRIEYNSADLTEAELDKLAAALTAEGLFGTSESKEVLFEKNNSDYEIAVLVNSTDINPENYQNFRDKLQTYFPGNKVILSLCKDDYMNRVRNFK